MKIERKLKGKFDPNLYSGLFPVIASSDPNKRAQYPFFPEKCFSYGCANWAASSRLSFADQFFHYVGLIWKYMDYKTLLPKLWREYQVYRLQYAHNKLV